MNRKEAIKKLGDIIDDYWIEIEEKGLDDEITEIIEALEKPATLADLLGWDEGVEYEYYPTQNNEITERVKIVDNIFYVFISSVADFVRCPIYSEDIPNMKQATKVKPKAYHVTDEYSYNELMKELEEQGYVWAGTRERMTEVKYDEIKTPGGIVFFDEDKNSSISYTDMRFYNKRFINKYDLIEYHKEEPKYLLQTDLTSEDGVQYLSFDKKRREYFIGALMTRENVQQKFTDSEILKIKSTTRFAKLCEKVEVEG